MARFSHETSWLWHHVKLFVGLSLAVVLGACTATLNEYQGSQPAFAMEEFFNGKLRAYGIVQNRSGAVTRRFSADLIGIWNDGEGVLDETFLFDDGSTQKRVWYLSRQADGSYHGLADDVVGVAKGGANGMALNWHYVLEIEVDGTVWEITLNDWMYLLDEKRLINKAEMTKFGFKVGELTLYIEKL